MKKILIGIILASSFIMSGDLKKCAEAVDVLGKYDKIINDTVYNLAMTRKAAREMKNNKIMRDLLKVKLQVIKRDEFRLQGYNDLRDSFNKQGILNCEGILNKKSINAFFKDEIK